MRSIFAKLNVVMLILFLFAAVVQVNDPDPFRWIAMYLAAAGCCAAYRFGRLPWGAPAVVAVAALLWAGQLMKGPAADVAPGTLFRSWEMASAPIEEAREMYGLLIVAAWTTALARRIRRERLVNAAGR